MEPKQQQDPPPRGAVSQRAATAVTTAITFLVGIVMIVDNYKLGSGWAKDGPQAGYFPLRVGVIICVASVVVFAQALIGKGTAGKTFVTLERLRPVLAVLVPTILYVAAIEFLGIYVASAIFVAAFMRVMDKYSWLKTIIISVGVNAALFWLFEIQFLVPLPKGPLEAMFGY